MNLNHSQLRELFIAACDLPESEQDAFIEKHCPDLDSQSELKRLLRSDAETSGIFADGETRDGVRLHLDIDFIEELPKQAADSRYELLGEIARGGMGAIIEGRDTELGRDLAIKILLDEHKDNAQIVQRFLEESQIAGQLQHPGIAPIYDVGQFADRRPFISMKLVKGETLAALLRNRKRTAEEHAKFIGVFEQICQTLAYAHSRGVIHRDLKPANIMVGAFGEVQVMDWGLAKVLSGDKLSIDSTTDGAQDENQHDRRIQTLRSNRSRSDSRIAESPTQAGSVMGTPAYMPPEQARGNIDQLDRRTDVFAMGAMLCEILTGKPIYWGQSSSQLLSLAVQCDTAECFRRLDEVDTDQALISLAKDCLSAERDDRPQDGTAVSKRITKYLESVETRLRAAEVERAAQKARADEERKRRRVTMAFAATVLLSIVLGAIGWNVLQKQKAESLAKTVIQINNLINDARLHQGLAESSNARTEPNLESQVRELEQAFASARDAEKLTEARNVDSQLRSAAQKLRASLETKMDRAHRLAEQFRFDRSIEKELNLIRLTNGRGKEAVALGRHGGFPNSKSAVPEQLILDFSETANLYRQTFLKAGIDFETSNVQTVESKIRESSIRESFINALDNWARALTPPPEANPNDSPIILDQKKKLEREKLLSIASNVDTNDLRKELRAALATNGIEKIKELATLERLQNQSNELICWLGSRLRNEREFAASVELLRNAQQRDPGDFWLNYELGVSLAASEGQAVEGLGYLRAALGIRPNSTAMLTELGQHLRRLKRFADAEAIDRRALEIDPNFAIGHTNLGVNLFKQAAVDDAISEFRRAIELDSKSLIAHYNLGTVLMTQNKVKEATVEFRKAVELDSKDAESSYHLALVLHRQGMIDEAIAEYRRTLELDPEMIDARLNLSGCWEQKGDFDQMIIELKTAIARNPSFADLHVNLANALAQNGKTDDAIACYRKAIEIAPNHPKAHYNFGYCLSTLGRDDEAAKLYRKTIELAPEYRNARVSLGLLLKKQGKLDEAIEEFRQLVEIAPKIPEHHYYLGIAQYRNEDWALAIGSFERSSKLCKQNVSLRISNTLYSAIAKWQLGSHDEARELQQAASELLKSNSGSLSGEQKALFKEAAKLMNEDKSCE